MKLRFSEAFFLAVLGAAAALIGDHSHVVTGTTVYYTDAVPYVWSSPFWFPLLVGTATVSLAELRLHLAAPRTMVTVRQGVAGVAVVVGMYVTTALMHGAPVFPATALICVAAIVIWCMLGDGPGAICGAIAAVVGPVVEIGLVEIGVFAYNPGSDGLFGVGPFLVPLYFAFGVVVALLGELVAARRVVPSAKTVSGSGAC
ncbi:MAG: diacylglycerol-binding protein [Mycobacterium sp.]